MEVMSSRAIWPTRIAVAPVTISSSKERLQLAQHEANVTCTLAGSAPDSLLTGFLAWRDEGVILGQRLKTRLRECGADVARCDAVGEGGADGGE